MVICLEYAFEKVDHRYDDEGKPDPNLSINMIYEDRTGYRRLQTIVFIELWKT